EALNEYRTIIERDPNNVVALNNAAWLGQELGVEEALELARRGLQLAPNSAPVLDTYGWILTERDQAPEGLVHLGRAAQLAPQAAEIRYHLAVAQARTGDRAAARQTLQALLAEG